MASTVRRSTGLSYVELLFTMQIRSYTHWVTVFHHLKSKISTINCVAIMIMKCFSLRSHALQLYTMSTKILLNAQKSQDDQDRAIDSRLAMTAIAC